MPGQRAKGLLDAVSDADFRSDVGEGLLSAVNRGMVGGLLGAPVDLITMALRPLGYGNQSPVMGSEWIGQRLQDLGAVRPERNPMAETLATLLGPPGAPPAARGIASLLDSLPGAVGSRASPPSILNQVGAMSPEGKKRLLSDLQAGASSGPFRLGDVTEGQGKALDGLFGRPSVSRDVVMTDDVLRHLVQKRLHADGFTPEEVTHFAELAMARRSRADLDRSKQAQYPSLLAPAQVDKATGRRFEARMPFAQTGDGLEARSVVPDGLPARKKDKAPRR